MNKERYLFTVSATAALGGVLFGFDTAVISGTIPSITRYFSLDAYSLGWAVSCILIGCAAGAMIAGKLADRIGRRSTLIVCAFLFALSGIGAALSDQLTLFIAARIAGGLGVGAAAMVSPMYIAETAPANLRGKLVSLYQLAIVLGILLAYCCNFLLEGAGEHNWRWMFASQTLPSIVFLILLLACPETPRWLISAGKHTAALALLARLNTPENALALFKEIHTSFHALPPARVRTLFSGTYRRILITGMLVAIFQQVTGINAVLYYAPAIFKQTGLDASAALLSTIGVGAVNVAATLIAICWVDRWGRRRFLVWGSALMGASLLGVAACFHYTFFGYYLILGLMLLYVGAFGCTLGAVTWVYLSEIFPNRIRALALAVSTLALWLADFLVSFTFPMLTGSLGTAGTILCYAACCLVALVFNLRLPETKGKALEELENLFTTV